MAKKPNPWTAPPYSPGAKVTSAARSGSTSSGGSRSRSSGGGTSGIGEALGQQSQALLDFLAGLGGGEVPSGGGGGDGGYEGDGGYAPDPALVAALMRLDSVEANARGQIDAADAQWRQRLAALRAMQEAENASAMKTITGDSATQLAAYNAALNPITADLQAQGFTASPIQQQAELDRSRMADYGQRQGDLSKRFAEIQNNTFADRDAAATGQMAGARAMLANTIAQMRAELEAEIGGGGGGGGGGGYGRRSSSGSDDASLSILKALAEANSPLADPRSSINYTGRHGGMVNAALGQINDDLSNVGRVQRRFVRQARAKDLNHGGFVKKAKNQVFKPLRKAAPGYQKSLAKKNVSAEYVRMWGLS